MVVVNSILVEPLEREIYALRPEVRDFDIVVVTPGPALNLFRPAFRGLVIFGLRNQVSVEKLAKDELPADAEELCQFYRSGLSR